MMISIHSPGSRRRLFALARLFVLPVLFVLAPAAGAVKTINFEPTDGDMTPVVREALEACTDAEIKLVFAQGIYRFRPDYAAEKYCFITNHDNGLKKIVFPLEGFESVEIEGNGAELIFHGQILPFLFEDCGKVSAKNLTIDWDFPFTFLGEVVALDAEAGWRDIRPFTDGFSWTVSGGRLAFPNIDGFNYSTVGSTLAFTADTKRVVHGALDLSSDPQRVEKRPDGILRFYEKLRQYPPIGSLLSSKGGKGENRYAPAFHLKSSRDIRFEGIVIHHALGMGFLLERCENAVLSKCSIVLRKGSDRVITSTADATHFCNCRGEILIENCRFENMLDDGTNVHGTYVEVDNVIDARTLRVRLVHFQQLGFEFAEAGDEIWFVHRPSPQRASTGKVASVRVLNDRFSELTFDQPLPDTLAKGDLLENKTWNPEFTMRGCTIRNHRARNIVLKTPRKTLIEDNFFSSMMSAVFLRGESFYWFESGAVDDVLIQNNRFEYCAYSDMEHAVLYVTPRLGESFDPDEPFDRNIRFEHNTIETFDPRIVWADRVDGLVIKGNTIRRTGEAEPLHPDAPVFEFKNCREVQLVNNIYEGTYSTAVQADANTRTTLRVDANTGF